MGQLKLLTMAAGSVLVFNVIAHAQPAPRPAVGPGGRALCVAAG